MKPRKPALTTPAVLLRRKCQKIASHHRAAARKAGVTLGYNAEDLRLYAEAHRTCAYCGLPVALDFQFDHIVPLARGGRHAIGNLCCCCSRCNQLKGALTSLEYQALRSFLAGLHPTASEDLCRRLLCGGSGYARNRRRKS